MNRLKSFFTTRGFYIALTLGVVAFAVLMGVYEYRENSEKFLGENSVDLNKSYVEGTPAVDTTEELDVTSNAAKNESGTTESVAGNTDAEKSETNEAAGKADSAADTNKSSQAAGKADSSTGTGNSAAADKTNAATDKTASATTDEDSAAAGSDNVTNIINEDGSEWTGYNGDTELVWPLIGSSGSYGDPENATGAIVIPYSMDTTVYFETLGVYKCNPGVMLKGAEGENVYSVYGGTVTSVEETKEFGTVVTVDMGNGYEAKYGQLMNITVSEGEVIASGQNIAEIGPVSTYYAKEGTHLYLALTKDETPVNPMAMIE
jgi:murein DD-endopeptidase MepM/ murein hydrolase activator NlpD